MRWSRALAALLVALSVAVQAAPDPAPRPAVGRSLVATELGMVAASQPLAARAGVQILEHGGSAVDAAIAANATLGLMEPTGNGMGGDLFALVYDAKTKHLYGLNSSGWAATGMTPAAVRAKAPPHTLTDLERAERVTDMPQRGALSVTVPGAVAGWDALRTRFGRLSFAEILAPAIYYAEHGFPLSEITAGNWARSVSMLSASPAAAHRPPRTATPPARTG